jgi:hypothetical protein
MSSRSTVLLPQYANEIRSRQSLDKSSPWTSHRVEQKTPINAKAFDRFVAYKEPIQLEKERVHDLRVQRDWLPVKYRDIDIYNLQVDGDDDEDSVSGDGDDDRDDSPRQSYTDNHI